MTTSTNNQRPIADFRMGSIKAAVWRHVNDRGVRYTTKFVRSYRDRNGDYRDTSVFDYDDLPVLEKLAGRAQVTICQLQDQDREAAQASSDAAEAGVAA